MADWENDPYKPVNPWAMALLSAAGGALQANRPGGTTGEAFGAALSNLGPNYMAAQRLNQMGLLRSEVMKQQQAKALREAEDRSRQERYDDMLRTGEALEGMSPQQRAALQPLIAVGDFDRAREAIKQFATREPKAPNPFEAFTSGDPALMAAAERWRTMGAPRTTTNVTANMGPSGIDYGDPEKGLVWKRDSSGKVALDERGAPIAIPYQGGSAYLAEQAAAAKADKAAAMHKRDRMLIEDEVLQAKNLINSTDFPVAGIGAWASAIPGTPQYDLRARLEPLKAYAAKNSLQETREASPTGGAYGNVSDFEVRMVQSTYGNLEQAQSREQLIYNLDRYLMLTDIASNEPADPEVRVQKMVGTMQPEDMAYYIKSRGGEGNLTAEERAAFEARLTELGL